MQTPGQSGFPGAANDVYDYWGKILEIRSSESRLTFPGNVLHRRSAPKAAWRKMKCS